MTAFYGLLGFDTAVLLLAAAGVSRGHAAIALRKRPAPRKPPQTEGTTP